MTPHPPISMNENISQEINNNEHNASMNKNYAFS